MAEVPGGLQTSATTEPVSGDLLDLLEARTRDLVDRYRQSKHTVEELRAKARERDRRLGELTERVRTLERRQVEARQRVQGMIDQIERLGQAEASAGSSGSATSRSPTPE
jgi:chromosome segregation ATPase